MNYVFGIDVGGTTVKIGLFTTEGTLVENGKSRPIHQTGARPSCRMLLQVWKKN